MRIVYLHGFASGPQSSKARFFQSRFADRGDRLEIPDLTAEGFENTTLTHQLMVVEREVDGGRVVLIGSSMGGYLAALFAARHPDLVAAVVLLAPAFGMARRWEDILGSEAMRQWRESGRRAVHHYADGQEAFIGYGIIEDGLQFEDYPEVKCRTLVVHGRRDESVDYRLSERFAAGRPNVELIVYDSDHQLLDMLEPMWEQVSGFLERLDA